MNLVAGLELAAEAGRLDLRHRRPRRRLHRQGRPTPASIIPPSSPDRITPHTEGLCAVIWHLLVSHPALATSRRRSGRSLTPVSLRPRTPGLEPRVLDRRRRRLHRQPLRRPAARGRRATERVTRLRQLLLGPRVAPRRTRRRPALRGRARRRRGLDGARAGDGRARHRHPSGLEPRHRRGDDRAGHRLRPGDRAHPARRRGDAADRRHADPLRVGQRRLRRPRARSRPTRTTGRWFPCRPTAPASWPARR